MTARKIKFDWSSIDRNNLINLFKEIKKDVIGKKLTPYKLHRIISKHIKQHLPIKITKSLSSNVKSESVTVGGFYYSWLDRKKYRAIEIQFQFDMFAKYIKLSDYKFNKLATNFSDIVLHEIIHLRQFRSRNFKYLPEYPSTAESYKQRQKQIYLGDRDEIDAYAFNIACELSDRFGFNQNVIAKYLDINLNDNRKIKDCWKMYLDTFDYDHQHPVIKKLKSKVIKYLPNAELGKPFKNKEWINY